MGTIINGNEFSWTSCEVKLLGLTFLGMVSINYGDKVAMEDAAGNGSISLGVAVGGYEAPVDFEMLQRESARFQAALGNPLSVKPFNIGLHYIEVPGAGVHTVEIIGARVMEISSARTRGPAATDKYTLKVTQPILRDGRALVAAPGNSIELSQALAVTL